MHAFEEGLVPMLLEVILDPLPDSSKKALDSLVESLFSKSNNRSTQRADYPRISFSGGYSSLTQLSADEKVGKLFALAIIGETEVGRKILSDRCDPYATGGHTHWLLWHLTGGNTHLLLRYVMGGNTHWLLCYAMGGQYRFLRYVTGGDTD